MHIEKFRATQTYRMCNHFERQEGDGITRGNENIHAERTHLNYNLCAHREESGYQQIQNILARDDVFVYGQGKRKDLVNMCDVVGSGAYSAAAGSGARAATGARTRGTRPCEDAQPRRWRKGF